MIKLGTHNSLSYIKPEQWWLRPFNWIAKCQKLNLKQQWDLGVRYFDIRVKFINPTTIKSGHGLVTYNIYPELGIAALDAYSKQCNEKFVVRLFHENGLLNPSKYRGEFISYCEYLAKVFPDVTFVEGGCRYDYYQAIKKTVPKRICYASYSKRFRLPCPKLWALKHNKNFHAQDNTIEYSIYDFIEL